MAASDGQVNITARIIADNKGVDETVRTLDKVGKKSKEVSQSSSASFKNAEEAVSKYAKILHSVTQISFVAGSLSSIVSLWDSIKEKASRAKEEAAEFAKEQAKAADKKKIDDLGESYRNLGKAIADAAKERQRANELEDLEVSEADKLEDSEANLAKAREIAALDPKDPAYAEKRQRIENAYEVSAAKRGVDRSRRDAETKERREYAEAEALHGEATEKSAAAIEDRAQAEVFRNRARNASEKSTEDNLHDAHDLYSNFFGQLKAILTFDTKHIGTHRTEEGDNERKRLEEEAKRLDEQAEALEKSAKAKEEEAAAIDAEATQHSNKAGVYGLIAANTSIAQDTAEIQGKVSTAEADRALARKEAEERRKAAEKARQEKELADARALLSGGDARAESLRSRIKAKDEMISNVEFQVRSGSMSADAGARVSAELQSQRTELNEFLSTLLRNMEESKRVIERANERLRNASGVDDSSEGA